jgi:hypothetical protein
MKTMMINPHVSVQYIGIKLTYRNRLRPAVIPDC